MTMVNIYAITWTTVSLIAFLSVIILDLLLHRDGFKLTGGLRSYIIICMIPLFHLYFICAAITVMFSLLLLMKQDRIQLLEETPEFAVEL